MCFSFSVFYSDQLLFIGIFLFNVMSIYKIPEVILFCLDVFKSIGGFVWLFSFLFL